MKKLLLIGFIAIFSNQIFADTVALDKYFNKEGYRVMTYIGNGLQQCFNLKINIKNLCEIKAKIAFKKASKLGLIFKSDYFLSNHFLSGLKTSLEENKAFKLAMIKTHGIKATSKLSEHEKIATLLLEDFKKKKFL